MRWPNWRTCVSAALIVFSFPPWDYSFLIWIALIPWFQALKKAKTPADGFYQGLWLSFLMGMGGFYWVASVLHEFGNLPWSLSVIGLLLFSAGGQPQFMAYGALRKWIDRRGAFGGVRFALALAFLYTGMDWLSPKLFADTLGHSMYQARNLRQLADLSGALSLTLIIFFVNDSIWKLWTTFRERKEPSIWPALRVSGPQAAVAACMMIFAFFYGVKRNHDIDSILASPHRTVNAGVIQANIGDFDKISAERGIRGARQKVMDTLFRLSDHALSLQPKPDFLVWPETSYPAIFRKPESTDELAKEQNIEHFVKDRDIMLLFGGYDKSPEGKDYNAFFFLNPNAEANEGDLQVYRKNILLLFGEYVPGTENLMMFRRYFPQVANFGRGIGPDVLKIFPSGDKKEPILAGPVICYEVLFPNYVISAARKGSQMILNITNDSWFGKNGEPQLHLALSIFRTIETRLPQVRSTNTGISALILPNGEITERGGIGTEEVLNFRVPILEPIPTLLKTWGDWFGPFALIVGAILLYGLMGRGKRGELA